MKKFIVTAALAAILALTGCAASSGQSSASGNSVEASSATSSGQLSTSADSAESEDTSAGGEEYVLYLGTNDKNTNKPIYSPEESKERAKAILMKDFGGYTIQEAEGGWRDDDGTEYQEYTLVIYLSDTDIDTVHAAAKELIDEFHQSSVLINTQRVESEFYPSE